ncbi:glycosyltransferase [Niabella sp. CJ426]|uniref:glycosyltransferase n=1 Tax=Niabella sp. CJ426 TaxID=3393740 RepID=UPI003CFEE517
MNNQFSIILPVRNGGEYLKESVNSILSQTYPQFNLFVLNNNSNDGTLEWLRSLKDERIIIKNSDTDLSMPDNWARALDLPLHEYITFIGHDDRLHEDYFRIMNNLIGQHPHASIYQTHFNYVDSQGKQVRSCQPMPEKIQVEDFLRLQFTQKMDSMGTGYLFRSNDYKKLGGFPAAYPNLLFGDYELFVKLTALSYMAISPHKGFDYRLHVSLSISTHIDKYCIAFGMYLHFLNEFQKSRKGVHKTIKEYGRVYLNYYCQSLSHRLLKVNTANRVSVSSFIKECKTNAILLGIKNFKPEHIFKIRIATILDSNAITRSLFQIVRKWLS